MTNYFENWRSIVTSQIASIKSNRSRRQENSSEAWCMGKMKSLQPQIPNKHQVPVPEAKPNRVLLLGGSIHSSIQSQC